MNQRVSFIKKLQLLMVGLWIKWLNFWLLFFQKLFFCQKTSNPKNILIYKIGNIGDIICAIPSFIAIRRSYPNVKITILTSPGVKSAPGARELLAGAWYLDEMKIYYADEIDSLSKKKKFIKNLRGNNYDLFIQLPDDLANFGTLFRNMIFAKFIGAKSAFGFKIRTIQLFKKTQVDYTTQKTEVESLLDLFEENGVTFEKVEYDFNISENQKKKVSNLLKNKAEKTQKKKLTVVLNPGGKREANRWPAENFGKIGEYLQKEYDAKIIIIGGKEDVAGANIIKSFLNQENSSILVNQLDLLEIVELFKNVDFLVSNDTGAAHMAAAVDLPVVGLYCIRNIFGRWFPYGQNHKILYHKFIDCDYRRESCIKKSVELITFNEAARACDDIIEELNKNYHGLQRKILR